MQLNSKLNIAKQSLDENFYHESTKERKHGKYKISCFLKFRVFVVNKKCHTIGSKTKYF
jgi:hypothetical protein